MTDDDDEATRLAPGGTVTPFRPRVPCPQCGTRSTGAPYPFCSKRCAQLDLGQWLTGGYAIAGDAADTPPDDA